MSASSVVLRSLKWTAVVLAAVLVCALGLVAAVNAGLGQSLLLRLVVLRVNRPVQVTGPIQAHLFSLHPGIVAEGITIDNPPWTPAGRAAQIGRLSLVLNLPWFGHPADIAKLEVQDVSLQLIRDPQGRANWQLNDPARPRPHRNSPIIRNLIVSKAHVTLADARRHLQFDGELSIPDSGVTNGAQPLRIQGSGQLNGRPVSFEIDADPLTSARHEAPYHFSFVESSSGTRIVGQGVLPQPFNYKIVEATFQAAGPDLKDLYFLTGVHLVDTGSYRLAGQVARRGTHTVYSDLHVLSGQSDMDGSVSIESASGRPQLGIDLHSRLLHVSDLGAGAAGRATGPKSPLLFSDVPLGPTILHGRDVKVMFRAGELDAGHLPLRNVLVAASLDHEVLEVSSLSADVLGGKAHGKISFDATRDTPSVKLDLRVSDLQLGQLPYKGAGPPPVEGRMQARILISGAGHSAHQIAAGANGTVNVQIPYGQVRESFAELTGIDLRGLGLLLTRNKREVPLRCAFAAFKAQNGTLTTQSLIVDTDPVLITGEGQLHLDSESLDLQIRGQPKRLRFFRLRAPLLIGGTLAHPSIKVRESHSTLEVIDRGKGQDKDCESLLAGH